MRTPCVGFIGAGNIATAILSGALSSGYIKSENVYIYDVLPEKAAALSTSGGSVCETACDLVARCDYVFLTVKPQVYDVVLAEIRSAVRPDCCLVDVAAGVPVDYVKHGVGFDCSVIRIMPNTPLMYGCGACALVHVKPVTDEQFAYVRGLLDRCGITCVVDEAEIDGIIGVSGSAPAYFFRFVRDIIAGGVAAGLSEEVASRMALQTMIGSARMIQQSDQPIDALIRAVASPNGTTEAGLRSLDETGFDASVAACVEATVRRSKELTRQVPPED